MVATLLKQPHQVSLSGNPVEFVFSLSPYTPAEQAQDIRLQLRILVEQAPGSNVFTEVRAQNFYPTSEGLVKMQIETILDPYLEFYTPRPTLQHPQPAISQSKRYKISWLLQKNNAVVQGPEESEAYHIIKSGLAYDAWHPSEFITLKVVTEKKPLSFPAKGEKIRLGETRFLYWLYPYADGAQQTVTYRLTFSDGTSKVIASETVSGRRWSIFCAPIGPDRLGFKTHIPEYQYLVSLGVKVTTEATTIVSEQVYQIDHQNIYDPCELIYRNSLGGLDNITLRGQIDTDADYDRQQARLTVPPAWYQGMNLMAQITAESTAETLSRTGETGFVSKPIALKLRDLFLSEQVCEVQKGRFIPVVMTAKKTKFFTNKDSLISLQLEWALAFSNEYFTPEGYMPQTRACPAMESFVVKQVSKNRLQIMYALQAPYDLVEVEIIIGVNTYKYTYRGNTRVVVQNFVNPATTEPVEITVRARTVCDETSRPADTGPWTTVTVAVVGNSLPVANDDYYTMPVGKSWTSLLPSALANDYDPDGDPIEAIANSGSSDKGGEFTIDAAGMISFKPQTTAWTGTDSFPYSIREVGGSQTVSAMIYVTVGDGAAAIYIKIVLKNVQMGGTGWSSYNSGDVWVEFFSNPAATIPANLTGMGITVNITDNYMTKEVNQEAVITPIDYSRIAIGTSMLLYSGMLAEVHVDQSANDDFGYWHQFVVLPGTGYVVI